MQKYQQQNWASRQRDGGQRNSPNSDKKPIGRDAKPADTKTGQNTIRMKKDK